MYKVIGIDEAGRGPVIGSLFIGFAMIFLEKKEDFNNFENHLKNLGVKDSKMLTPKKRNEIFELLKKNLDFKYVQLTPQMIDSQIFSGKTINELQLNAVIHILNQEKPDMIVLDAPIADTEKYKKMLLSKLNYVPDKVISENKADVNYAIVGAASIIAKELREREVKDIKDKLKIDFGSGYPSDEKTKLFLKENFNNKDIDFIFRKSWQTFFNYKSTKDKNLKNFF